MNYELRIMNKKEKGFSLLELLIYIALLSILMTVIAGVFISVNRGRGQAEAVSEVNSNLRFAFEKISQDLRFADSVTTPSSAGATSTSLVVNVSGTAVTYCVVDWKLKRQVNGSCVVGSESVTSDTVAVKNSVFRRIENTNAFFSKTVVSMEINLTMDYNSSSPDWQYSGSKKTTISLR